MAQKDLEGLLLRAVTIQTYSKPESPPSHMEAAEQAIDELELSKLEMHWLLLRAVRRSEIPDSLQKEIQEGKEGHSVETLRHALALCVARITEGHPELYLPQSEDPNES